MSDYDRNLSGPGLNRPNLGQPGFNSTTTDPTYRDRLAASSPAGWIGGVIVALLVIVALGYAFSGSYTGSRVTEHRAAATDNAVGPPPPITARPAPSPSDRSK